MALRTSNLVLSVFWMLVRIPVKSLGGTAPVEVLEDTVPVSAGGRRERELVGAAAVGLGPGSSAAFLFFLFPVVHHRPFSYSIAK